MLFSWCFKYLCCVFLLLQIRKTRKVKVINHGAKVAGLLRPPHNQVWFWDPVRASGLHDLIYTGYANVPHALLLTLCERWHTETSSFHLSVGEMSITLDDVACLMHIPIEGRMLDHRKKVSQVIGVDLMVAYLGVAKNVAVSNCKDQYGAYISYKALKELYEDHLSVAMRLADAQTVQEIQERDRRRDACVRSFLLYLVGCVLFGDKSNKRIELIYLQTMDDYDTMRDYSWGGMSLAYLYHCLSEVSLPKGKALGGSTTLLMVINCVTFFNLKTFFFLLLGNNL